MYPCALMLTLTTVVVQNEPVMFYKEQKLDISAL